MCATKRASKKKAPKVRAEQPKARAELPKARTEVRSEQPSSIYDKPKARSVQQVRPKTYSEQQPIVRSKPQPQPVASKVFSMSQAEVAAQRRALQQHQSNNGSAINAGRSIPEAKGNKSDVPRNLTGIEQAGRDSESDNGSLEELYDQKEGDNGSNNVSPPNRRHLSVYQGPNEKDEELEWSSFEDESVEEEMTAEFQRRIIGQTVTALKIKGGASCLATLVEIASNLRFKDVRFRTIVTTGRKFKTKSFFIHKEAVGAIEAIGFVPVGSKNEVFAWDPAFSPLSVEEIIEAVDKPRRNNVLNNEMSFMTVDTEEINAIHDAFGEEDQRVEGGVHIMSE